MGLKTHFYVLEILMVIIAVGLIFGASGIYTLTRGPQGLDRHTILRQVEQAARDSITADSLMKTQSIKDCWIAHSLVVNALTTLVTLRELLSSKQLRSILNHDHNIDHTIERLTRQQAEVESQQVGLDVSHEAAKYRGHVHVRLRGDDDGEE